ncbi:MAG: hypothetical protein COB30_009660 [Ectothiorhodospiraceae bacterium]|nr:hypothetical protein [Ectothiorhodospiraceae bacterium]
MYINLKILPGMGPSEGTRELVAFKDFLTRYSPQLSMTVRCCKQFPPLHVVNEELMSGGRDLGMSGGYFWKAFEISEAEYNQFREEILTDPSLDIEYDIELELKPSLKKWCGAVLSKHNPRRKNSV